MLLCAASAEDYTVQPSLGNDVSLVKEPADGDFAVGINGGAGLIYKMTKWVGFKATAGYSLMASLSEIDPEGSGNADSYFIPYKSHPYVTVGVRFLLSSSDD